MMSLRGRGYGAPGSNEGGLVPFVELLHDPERVEFAVVLAVRDALPSVIASHLEAVDPEHAVTPAMVDVRVLEASPHDRLACPLYVTILSRTEPARRHGHDAFVAAVTEDLGAVGLPLDAMVESILTDRASSYRYS
jgi:hypothetical protein